MQCTNPIRIGDRVVSCGKCMSCRVKRTQEWSTRLMDEVSYWKESCFLTLTYNNQNLPIDKSLSKEVVQLYLKRLRKNSGKEIKYYAAGEYGEKDQRPHYHIILFGIGSKSRKIMEESWRKGFIYLRPVCAETTRYVAAYVQKKLSGPMAKEFYGNRTPPFSLMSKGLGKRWANDNAEMLSRYKTITIKGIPCGIPRYYVKIAPIDLGLLPYWGDGMIADRINDAALARREWLDANIPMTQQWSQAQKRREQDDATLRAKLSMRRRK